MRAFPNTLLTALLLTATGTAVAASSVDLTVKGLITPSACTPALSDGGKLELGKISAKDLKADDYTVLDDHVMQLTVTCEAATLMAIEPKDNRAGSEFMNEPGYFGLGLINGNEKVGSLSMFLEAVTADGVASRATDSLDGGLTWVRHSGVGPDRITSVADTSTLAPIPVQLFTADLTMTPIIAPTNGLTLTSEAPVDGSVTLTVKYL